ncbi:HEAT repeat domain-containing protein [Kitasatospora sp. NPDC057738]|uniref:HEAT repeat domain-containing protein n=1 Tax=Kitasatospora sp. NPDC057738 TaxID=3346233 RepID=UPI0036A6F938
MNGDERSGSGEYLGRPTASWAALARSDDPTERRLGAYALGETGSADAVPLLEAALGDPLSFVRVWAAAALARADPEREEDVVRALSAESSDPAGFVRSLVAWSLGRLDYQRADSSAAVRTLRLLLDDPDASVRAEAELALHHLVRSAGRADSAD